jgi:hypothetical protein
MAPTVSNPGFHRCPMEHLRGVFGGGGSLRRRRQATSRKIGRNSNRAGLDVTAAEAAAGKEVLVTIPERQETITVKIPAGENRGAQWRFLHPAACEVAGEHRVCSQRGLRTETLESHAESHLGGRVFDHHPFGPKPMILPCLLPGRCESGKCLFVLQRAPYASSLARASRQSTPAV